MNNCLIGQRCIVGSGTVNGYIGMVTGWCDRFPHQYIAVEHPVTHVVCRYSPGNVHLLPVEQEAQREQD